MYSWLPKHMHSDKITLTPCLCWGSPEGVLGRRTSCCTAIQLSIWGVTCTTIVTWYQEQLVQLAAVMVLELGQIGTSSAPWFDHSQKRVVALLRFYPDSLKHVMKRIQRDSLQLDKSINKSDHEQQSSTYYSVGSVYCSMST